eukprot:scaffold1895_cov129-Skeletonema_menzelii.AAC.3
MTTNPLDNEELSQILILDSDEQNTSRTPVNDEQWQQLPPSDSRPVEAAATAVSTAVEEATKSVSIC